MNSRKILIVVIALVVIMFGVGVYFLFSSSKTTPPATQANQTGTAGTLPSTGTQSNTAAISETGALATGNNATLGTNFGVISNQPALDYFVDASNDTLIIQPDGEIDEVINGQSSVLNPLLIQNIIRAGFSYDGSKVLVNFGNPADPQTSIFNIATKTWTPMAAGWLSPAWSPSDYRIAYAIEGSSGTETFSTFDASKPKTAPVSLITLQAQDLSVAWATKTQLAFQTKPSALVAGSSWLYNLTTRILTPIAIETPGVETTWSGMALGSTQPMGLQFSAETSGGGSLQLINTSGNTIQQIKFLTLPSKCAFNSAASTTATTATVTSTPYLYCAVPRDQSDFAFDRLPDSYNQMSLFTIDDIYRINLSTGAIDTVFADQNQNLDVSDLKIFNNTAFFINRYDQKLYAITLAR